MNSHYSDLDSNDEVASRLKANGPAAESLLRAAFEELHPAIALACSFSPEDIVLAHMLAGIRADARVFAIDTGRLHEETYETADLCRRRFGIRVEWYFPDRKSTERLERDRGLFSFRESLDARHECCGIRKVEPLGRALYGLRAWITGLRREQSPTRTAIATVERDGAHGGILKLNPLADRSTQQVQEYVDRHELPVNPLLSAGFTSIGCAPCTRPVKPGEDPRAGRWWWESPEHKECGLHPVISVRG